MSAVNIRILHIYHRTYLAEQPTSSSSLEVDVHIVILSAHRLFHEGFLQDLSVDDDRIAVFSEAHFRCYLEPAKADTDLLLHMRPQLLVNLGSPVP